MVEFKSRAEFLKARAVEQWLNLKENEGARLTLVQREVVREVLWQGFRRDQGLYPKAMNPRQRNVKKTMVDGARSSLVDLQVFTYLFGGCGPLAAGFTETNLQRAVPPQRLAELVSDVIRASRKLGNSGREYADLLVSTLEDAYRQQGERIQIVRELARNPFLPTHR